MSGSGGHSGGSARNRDPFAPSKTVRVLIVEDDAVSYSLISEIIQSIDSSILVEWCQHVNEAEKFLSEKWVSLIISDYNLKGAQTGIDLWRAKLLTHPGIPFILITGENIEAIKRIEGQDVTFPYLLKKPLKVTATRFVLCEALRLIDDEFKVA